MFQIAKELQQKPKQQGRRMQNAKIIRVDQNIFRGKTKEHKLAIRKNSRRNHRSFMFSNISSPAYRKDKAILCLLAGIGKVEGWGGENEGGRWFDMGVWGS